MDSFRDLLRAEFEARSARNPRYSLRAFARSLGVSPATVCETLSGRHVPSLKTAEKIANAMPWPEPQRRSFVELVAAARA